MSCTTPCLSCTASTFYSCTSCPSSLTLSSTFCLTSPTFIFQVVCTCLLPLFILVPASRKRALTLIRVYHSLQTLSLLKYVLNYTVFRHNYLYLQMRAWDPWTQGWALINDTNVPPLMLFEETAINKAIRIGAAYIAAITFLFIASVIKSLCQNKVTFTMYFRKNIGNLISLCFYITCMDIALFVAQIGFGNWFNTTTQIILFIGAILLGLSSVIMFVWMFNTINNENVQQKQQKVTPNNLNNMSNTPKQLHYYQYMFLHSFDYDLFPTYFLLSLPTKSKVIHRYSNLILLSMFQRMWLAASCMSYLKHPPYSQSEQLYIFLGIILINRFIFYMVFPFAKCCQQIIQIILNILVDCLVIIILFFPFLFNDLSYQIIHLSLLLAIYVIAFTSVILQLCMMRYQVIPMDLYMTGQVIPIEDLLLKNMLKMRQQEMEKNKRRMKQIEEENERLQDRLRNNNNKVIPQIEEPSQQSIAPKQKPKEQQIETKTNMLDKEEEKEDDYDPYTIDPKKRRKVYEYNKKLQFSYSNKMQMD